MIETFFLSYVEEQKFKIMFSSKLCEAETFSDIQVLNAIGNYYRTYNSTSGSS